jgi:hypothetical protein
MGLFGFSFGKKRKTSKRSKKVSKKPPSRLLSICKRYKVKATRKSGGRRVYKAIAVLKKECLKKAMAMLKKIKKMKRSKSSFGAKRKTRRKVARRGDDDDEPVKRRRRRRSGFGEMMPNYGSVPSFGRRRRSGFGEMMPNYGSDLSMTNFGRRRRSGFGEMMPNYGSDLSMTNFGKRRRTTNRKVAMKAFRSFYKRHCAGSRRSRFGNGGNPPLYASMGYEFCPNGMGGVLGANSTGLFPSPCTSSKQSSSMPVGYQMPSTTGNVAADFKARQAQYATKFGRRRKVTRRKTRKVTRRKCRKVTRKVTRRVCRKVTRRRRKTRRSDDDM